MRLPISLLALTAFLVGCSTDEDPAITQTITVTSTPNSAVIRLNGTAVGRTPGTITVESNSDYQLEIGKGGFAPSLTELKPSLKTDSKGNMYYGFPERIAITLDRLPGSDDVKVPEADEKEFKKLSNVALGTADQIIVEPGSADSMRESVLKIKEEIKKVRENLAQQNAASDAKMAALKKSLAEAKSPEFLKSSAELDARVAEAEKALLKAIQTRNDITSQNAANTIAALETRQNNLENKIDAVQAKEIAAKLEAAKASILTALSDSDRTVAQAQEELKKAHADREAALNGKGGAEHVAALEAQISAQQSDTEKSRQSTDNLLKALDARTEELVRLNKDTANLAKAEATKDVEAQKALAAKEAEEKAKAEAAKQLEEQKAIAAKEAEEKARAEADKQLASVQRIMEEQKTLAAKAEEQRAAAEQQRAAAEMEAKKRVYADFSSRYALLESRRRNKLISEDEFKDQLAALRKELTK